MGKPGAWRQNSGTPEAIRRMRSGGQTVNRLLLLIGSMVGAAVLIFTWSTALEVAAGERAEREATQQARALAAARSARDNVPRTIEPADRALGMLQARVAALARNDRREAEAIEQTLLGLTRRAQDGIRALAATDGQGSVVWQSQQGNQAVQPWLGNAEFFLAHRYGRMAPILSRAGGQGANGGLGGGGLILSTPLQGPGGAFAGVLLAVLDPQRLGGALPATSLPTDPQLLLFHSDGTLIARGRNAAMAQQSPRLDNSMTPELMSGGGGERIATRRDPDSGNPVAFAATLVPGYDLVVLASVEAVQGGIATSRIALVVFGLAGAISCLVCAGLLWLFGRGMRVGEPEETSFEAADEAEAPAPPVSLALLPPALPPPALTPPAPAPSVVRPAQLAPPRREEPAPIPAAVPEALALPMPMAASGGFIEAMPTVAYAARIIPASPGLERQIRVTAVNSTLLQLTGWEASAFQDVPKWQRSIDWGSYPPGAPLLERLAEPAGVAEKVTEEGQVEYRLRRPDGSWMWLRETAKVVGRHPTHVDVLGCLADVTRERELAAQADSASRVAARGAMAAGLAHELNQPLAVMSLAAENALEALEEGEAGIPEALARLRRISAQAERAKAIAAQLRSFARLEAAVLEPVSLPAAVRGALSLVGGALSEARVEVELRMAPGLPAVRGQPVLVEQLVVNLCLNARDAMVSRGEGERRLTIIGEPGVETHEIRLVVAGHRRRHPGRGAGAGVRPVLHHQAGQQGHRAWVAAVPLHHAALWRQYRPDQPQQRPGRGGGADVPSGRGNRKRSGARWRRWCKGFAETPGWPCRHPAGRRTGPGAPGGRTVGRRRIWTFQAFGKPVKT